MYFLGQNGTLGVIVRKNNPVDVRCGDQPQTYGQDDCSLLLRALPTDTAPQLVFGAYRATLEGHHTMLMN